jgi:hypothetical protein
MLHKLQSHGHSSFIALPNLPSRDLLTLCFSRGLLSCVAESNKLKRLIFAEGKNVGGVGGELVGKTEEEEDT